MKKDCAIVFGIKDNYTFALANVLIGMRKHCLKFWDDIIVIHNNDVSKENRELLNKILECKFIDFGKEEWCKEIAGSIPKKFFDRFSIATFFKYECFNLLSEYKKVVFSDVDVLVQSDFSDIVKYGDKTGLASVVMNHALVEKLFKKPIDKYDMYLPVYSAGLLVLSDNLPQHELICDRLCELTVQYADLLVQSDQSIINLMLQEQRITTEEIDIKYNCFPTFPEAKLPEKSPIVHAVGVQKFWHDTEECSSFPEWHENNKIFLELKETGSYPIEQVSNTNDWHKISVIMPVCNNHSNLAIADTVKSVLTQTYSHFEFIILLNFSQWQNDIERALTSYNDDRIKIIKTSEMLSIPALLNKGLDNASGEFVAFMDADCVSHPYRFEKQIDYLVHHPDISICGTFYEPDTHYDFSPLPMLETDPDMLKIEMLHKRPLFHPSLMVRKSDLTNHNLCYTKTSPDSVFDGSYDLLARAAEFLQMANLPISLLQYKDVHRNPFERNETKKYLNNIDVMRYQFERYLNIIPTNDELHLFDGKLIHAISNNKSIKYANKVLNNFKKRIIEANKQTNFYNREKLVKYLKTSTPVFRIRLRDTKVVVGINYVFHILLRIRRFILDRLFSR